jgi:hypothetical protein
MSLTDPCRRCGQKSAWLLRPVREMDGIVPVETHGRDKAFTRLGWYEAVVCAGCGNAQFWARDYQPERAPQAMDGCLDCGGTSGWRVDEAPDLQTETSARRIPLKLAPLRFKLSLLFGGSGWQGTLAVNVCARCSAAAWFCRPEAVVDPDDLGEKPLSPRACSRCQGAQTLVPLRDDSPHGEDATYERAVVADRREGFFGYALKRFGRFEVDVCRQCFAVDWHATNLDELREDPHLGVSKIERGPFDDGGRGPYR